MADRELLVVLGAGASYDCANEASICDAAHRPPLARELFHVASRPAFWEVLRQYPGAMALAPDLAELSLQSAVSIEDELRKLASHSDSLTRQHFEDIPRYLSSLLTSVSKKYASMPGSYVRLVKRLVADEPHRVTFVSLNYDDLLEQGIQSYVRGLSFDHISDYVHRDRSIWVVKPHGSIDWFVKTTKYTSHDFSRSSPTVRYEVPVRPWTIQVRRDLGVPLHGEVYPVVTAPMSEKTNQDLVCPDEHVQCLIHACCKAEKALFIGTSGLDGHILRLIGEYAKSLRMVHIVGKDEMGDIRERIAGSLRSVDSQAYEIFDQGFRAYLQHPRFEAFARV